MAQQQLQILQMDSLKFLLNKIPQINKPTAHKCIAASGGCTLKQSATNFSSRNRFTPKSKLMDIKKQAVLEYLTQGFT
jgi:hypothetical protein